MIPTLLMLPMITAVISWSLSASAKRQWLASLAGASLWAAVAIAAVVTTTSDGATAWASGSWLPPLGIALVLDSLAAALVAIVSLVGVAVVMTLGPADDKPRSRLIHPMVHLLLWGVTGSFLTGDLFNLFVWFEVMLLSSFVLLAIDAGGRGGEGVVKYVSLNLIASAIFLIGAGVIYGTAGTLNFADLGRVLAQETTVADTPVGVRLGISCVLVAFLIKSAAFPLFTWLPSSYHLCQPAIAALFAGLLTKVGVYACLRFTTAVVPMGDGFYQPLLIGVAVLTMVTGVIGAATQMEMKRILAFHIISQVGYMLLAVGLATPLAYAAAAFYLIHHIVVKANLFLIAGLAARYGGSDDLRKIGGLDNRVVLTICAIIAAFSLAGIPPLSGFFAKLAVVRAAIDAGDALAVTAALATGFYTLYSMIKIHREAFVKPAPDDAVAPPSGGTGWSLAAIAVLAGTTIVIGLGAGQVWDVCLTIGQELSDPLQYRSLVLGEGAS